MVKLRFAMTSKLGTAIVAALDSIFARDQPLPHGSAGRGLAPDPAQSRSLLGHTGVLDLPSPAGSDPVPTLPPTPRPSCTQCRVCAGSECGVPRTLQCRPQSPAGRPRFPT